MDAVGTGVKGKRAKRKLMLDNPLWLTDLKDSNGICSDCDEGFTPRFRAQYTCDACRAMAWVRHKGESLIGLAIKLQAGCRRL